MSAHRWHRREVLALGAGGLLASRRLLAAQAPLRVMAVGQALVLRDLAAQKNPGYAAIRQRLSQGDVRFTNLEVAIRGASAPSIPIGGGQSVNADPVVLDSLKDLSFNLLSLSNNHADDLGEAGFLSTIEETRRRGFTTAGTGRTLAEAARAGELMTPNGAVALVAMASSALDPSAFATATRAGVNHLAMRGDAVDPADAERVLSAISAAASRGRRVIVYQHDHYWATNWQDTPDWKKRWCRACIDAGAIAFVSHGVPILHGIEIYKQRPIFYGLGNFIFHIAFEFAGRVPAPYSQTFCWQSVIADCEFDGSNIRSLRLEPITLKSDVPLGEGPYTLHGNPRLAEGTEAAEILTRLRTLSAALGTQIDIIGTSARVEI